MWSDSIPSARMREIVALLHSILPRPSASFAIRTPLQGQPSPEQLAELLHATPGFSWLDGANTRQILLDQPLATISCNGETASASGPGGTVQFPARAMDVLDAMLEAWRGPSEALLVGFLSYDLAGEIEDLDPQPECDFSFPTLHFGLFDSALVREDGARAQ